MNNLWLNPELLSRVRDEGRSIDEGLSRDRGAQRRREHREPPPGGRASQDGSRSDTQRSTDAGECNPTGQRARVPAPSRLRRARHMPAARSGQSTSDEFASTLQRERRTRTRRLCLRLVAAALLGGSAAFSYVAWSDELRAGLTRHTPLTTTPVSAQQVHALRRENVALRERIARLERAIGAVAAGR